MSLLHLWVLYKGEPAAAWGNFRDSLEEHLWQIDWVEPKVVFLETALLDKYYPELHRRGIRIVCMDPPADRNDGVESFWELMEGVSDAPTGVVHDLHEGRVLYRFTGGTTGKGKCVMYTAGNWLATVRHCHGAPDDIIRPGQKHLSITPLSHASGSLVLPLFFKGATHVTMNVPDLKQLCTNIQKERIATTLLVPTILYRLLEAEFEKTMDLSSLNYIFYGASPMSPRKIKDLQARFGNIFVQFYGSSECVAPVTVLSTGDHSGETERERKRLASAGTPLPGVEVIVADEEGREAPQGETGELWFRSASVGVGYLKNPEGTAAEFTEDGFWKSGDMGYLDEGGYIYIVDRKKDMIITGGFNVYATEVEDALNSHPAVLMSAVVGIPHEEWGEAVHAEVILRESAGVEAAELIEFCKEKKGKYKAPKSITFVKELPVTAVGKVLRRKVREKYWEGRERRVH
jgi:fatty-acyl-CoA synthase